MQENSPKPGKTARIGVAMSGGVDSSVTVRLLQEEGVSVVGFFMALAQPDLEAQIERVRNIARYLGVELAVIDLRQEFRHRVLDYFTATYRAGRTPNPCAVCNRLIKFGLLLEAARLRGIEELATGHYVRIERDAAGRARLRRGLDPRKDQSYFLCRLEQRQLARIRTPLGARSKDEVYRLAAGFGLAGRHGSESQDVCFLQNTTIPEFLARQAENLEPAGEIVAVDGRILGRHQGISRYTIGQRRGLGIPDATPYYVVALDPETNRVVVGKDHDLLRHSVRLVEENWLGGAGPELPARFEVQIRYHHKPVPATLEATENGPSGRRALVARFDEPQRAVTPGQFAAFYRGDELLGSAEMVG